MSKELTLFKSHQEYATTCTPKGKMVVFRQHMFATADKDTIEWLQLEIDAGHPNFYVDTSKLTVDEDYLNPVEQLKKQLRAEIVAELAAKNKDMGSYDPGKIKAASSESLAALTVGNKLDGRAQTQIAQESGKDN